MKVGDWQRALNIICLVSALFSFSLFLKCYFPVKHGLSGSASIKDVPHEPVSDRAGLPKAHYNRLVLMVIDALRTDFVLGAQSLMPFTQQLLQAGKGVSYTAKTHLPTVTLPRIKSITSGSIPGFVDVVLNFGSTVLTEDNLINQLELAGKSMTFFGDDTWLSLFPHHFKRHDGTTSFFVTDFTEVDVNVTRHLREELIAEDWDVMILHYLGLDHIGHVYGPASNLVPPKLLEMDAVVELIFSAMKLWGSEKSTALVICGDHGMSDQGGHGGASPGETSVPVIIISPHTHFQPQHGETWKLQQIDLCPTLSALLGLPIPRNNLGRVAVSALPLNTALQDKVRLLQLNAAQMVDILNKNVENIEEDRAFQLYQETMETHSLWLVSQNSSSSMSWEAMGLRVLTGYQDTVQKISQRIGQTSTSYDMHGIVIAITSLWLILFVQGSFFLHKTATASLSMHSGELAIPLLVIMMFILSHVTTCTSQYSSDILCGTSFSSLNVQLLTFMILCCNCMFLLTIIHSTLTSKLKGCIKPLGTAESLLVAYTGLHSLSLLSSSFVEEEHQTWYFFTTSLFVLLTLHHLSHLAADWYVATVHEPAKTLHRHDRDQFSVWTNADKPVLNCKLSPARKSFTSEHSQEKSGIDAETAVKNRVWIVASLAVILLICRLLRRWNQTGNKWLDTPDIGDWFVRPENKSCLSALVVMSVVYLLLSHLDIVRGLIGRSLFAGALLYIYLSKAASGSLYLPEIGRAYVSSQGVMEAKLAYVLILGLFICHFKQKDPRNISSSSATLAKQSNQERAFNNIPSGESHRYKLGSEQYSECGESHHSEPGSEQYPDIDNQDSGHSSTPARNEPRRLWESVSVSWLCMMCLLLRPHNLAVVAMTSVIEKLVCRFLLPHLQLRPSCLLLFCLMMGQSTFFFQGNSNSLSTVDVSAGLTALYDYHPVIIGIQMAMSTYAGVIFWLISSLKYVAVNTKRWWPGLHTELSTVALLSRVLPLSVYTVLVTIMRYHLFVWTVFSPKLLYEGMLTLIISVFCMLCLLTAQTL